MREKGNKYDQPGRARCAGVGPVSLFVSLVLSALVLAPAAPASAASFSAARFVVRGAPLLRAGHVVAGRSVSVFARPVVVSVDGCRASGSSVRVRRGVVSVAARLGCAGIPGAARLVASIRGVAMSGRVTHGKQVRRFTARLAVQKGVLLRGRPGAAALGAVRDTDALSAHPAGEFSSSRGGEVLRTELVVTLGRSARVAQVNAALGLVGGRIAGALVSVPTVVVSIPDPGDLGALDRLRERLAHQPGVARAERSLLGGADDLPAGFSLPLDTSGQLALHHLLAIRMPAAWNAQNALLPLADRPLVVVQDVFGQGPLDKHVDVELARSGTITSGSNDPFADGHGYHVTGIIAANQASDGSFAGLVTGVFPTTTRLDPVDLADRETDQDMFVLLGNELDLMSAFAPHIVVNTSLHFADGESDAQMQTIASSWATFIRTHHLEDRVLQATSAGNQHALPAAGNSGWSAAALRSDLTTPEGSSQPPLGDILVVENTSDSGAPAYQPGCLSPSSNIGGTIAAPGVGVYSNLIGADAGPESGTSMSSPEVAGLAEYLWSINPDLTAPEIVRLIGQTAQPPRVACQDAPVLDAYAATLGLDEPGCFIATCAPSRLATLDVAAPHGRFDQADVQELADHIFKTPAPTDRDWSRYDLNGDGFTGGESAAPFDLDTTGSVRGGRPILTTVTQAIHDTSGNPIEVQFDETKATDADILCYYAYSNLYTPATQNDQRDKILGDHCTPPVRVVQCGTEADSTTFAQIGSTQQTFPKDGSASHPQCTPQLNSVLPDNKSEVKTQSGCGSAAASPCDALARANGTMTAAGVVSLHGGTIRFSAKGDISGSETGGNSSADVQADSSIQFRLSTACTFTASGTIITSSGGGGAVASPAVRLTGPSGTLLNVTTGTNNANGMLQPGFYSFGGTANPNGNADSSNATFDAHADLSGTVNIAC